MRTLLLVLSVLFCGCRASDVVPDEFRVDYGHGWADSTFDQRQTDFSTNANSVGFGFTWYLGKSAAQSELNRQHELLMQFMREAPVHQPAPVVPEERPGLKDSHSGKESDTAVHEKPERGSRDNPQHVELGGISGSAREYLFYALGALVLTIAAVVKRKMLVDVGVRVKHEVHRRIRRGPKEPPKPSHKHPPGPRSPTGA